MPTWDRIRILLGSRCRGYVYDFHTQLHLEYRYEEQGLILADTMRKFSHLRQRSLVR
jgi:hypothetical protein